LASLNSELTIGYLDDLTLGGEQSVVASDVKRIAEVGKDLGLSMNIAKCELVTHSNTLISQPSLMAFKRMEVKDCSLLGAPLFQGDSLDHAWEDRCNDLTRASDRLKSIRAQDALLLLRASFGAPRVQHLLRCSPSVDHPNLAIFDELQRNALSRLSNSNLSDLQWIRASLPVSDGGLGLRRVSSLALPSFLASSASTASIQEAILAACPCLSESLQTLYSDMWTDLFGPAPVGSLASKQHVWDAPCTLADRDCVQSSLLSSRDKAVFLAASAPHSGAWLSALPLASCGLRLDDEAVRVGIALRLGLPLCAAHDCHCGGHVDIWGSHASVCKKAPGRIQRHFAVNDIIARAITSAGVPITKEPTGLARSNGKRPDGLTLIPWGGGKALAWDATISSTLAASYVQASSTLAGSASESAASNKVSKYSFLQPDYIVQPVSFESLGPCSASTSDFIVELGHKISQVSGDSREVLYLWQRLSICLQRFNSVLLLQSFTNSFVEPDG